MQSIPYFPQIEKSELELLTIFFLLADRVPHVRHEFRPRMISQHPQQPSTGCNHDQHEHS